jgi:hypothetical protein
VAHATRAPCREQRKKESLNSTVTMVATSTGAPSRTTVEGTHDLISMRGAKGLRHEGISDTGESLVVS